MASVRVFRFLENKSLGEKGRWRLYRLVWVEYGLRGLFASAGLAALLVPRGVWFVPCAELVPVFVWF